MDAFKERRWVELGNSWPPLRRFPWRATLLFLWYSWHGPLLHKVFPAQTCRNTIAIADANSLSPGQGTDTSKAQSTHATEACQSATLVEAEGALTSIVISVSTSASAQAFPARRVQFSESKAPQAGIYSCSQRKLRLQSKHE